MSTKVLVVDDELDTLNLLRVLLELTGFEPVTTLNSTEAITLAEIEKVDVALLDIMMPKLDGFQLCRMMREHDTLKSLPIIFVTAYDALDLEDRRREVGADHVVNKPINIDLLTNVIKEIQEKRSLESLSAPTPAADTTPKTEANPVTEAKPAEVTEAKPEAKTDEKPVAATPVATPEAKPTEASPATPAQADKPTTPEPAKPAAEPASPMPMTFVSASNDDDASAELPKPTPPTATTPSPSVAKPATPSSASSENKEPEHDTAKPTLASDTPNDKGDDTSSNSKNDRTPLKPHRPPTPQ